MEMFGPLKLSHLEDLELQTCVVVITPPLTGSWEFSWDSWYARLAQCALRHILKVITFFKGNSFSLILFPDFAYCIILFLLVFSMFSTPINSLKQEFIQLNINDFGTCQFLLQRQEKEYSTNSGIFVSISSSLHYINHGHTPAIAI